MLKDINFLEALKRHDEGKNSTCREEKEGRLGQRPIVKDDTRFNKP